MASSEQLRWPGEPALMFSLWKLLVCLDPPHVLDVCERCERWLALRKKLCLSLSRACAAASDGVASRRPAGGGGLGRISRAR